MAPDNAPYEAAYDLTDDPHGGIGWCKFLAFVCLFLIVEKFRDWRGT